MDNDHQTPPTISDGGAYDTVWNCVIPYLDDARHRAAAALVCRRWRDIDAATRLHVRRVSLFLCYAAAPEMLSRRFPRLESLKVKGRPYAVAFHMLPERWGGYAAPWVVEIARSFGMMKEVNFWRMVVTDSDLELLAASKAGKVLEVLKLDKCGGFSTDGLLHICRHCRSLRSLFMAESSIEDKDGEWLHELALNNTVLESLNFYLTDLMAIALQDLELIARRCQSLTLMKISELDIFHLIGFFRAATSLEEFGGGTFGEPPELVDEGVGNEQLERYGAVVFPPKLCRLSLTSLGNTEIPILYPVVSTLKKLDLLYALLNTEGLCTLLQRCPNLEILEAGVVIGDRGLEVLAQFCKNLKRLKIRGIGGGVISQRGLIALAQGCLQLEYLAVHVSDITNASLECIGTYSKNLCDFRLLLLDNKETITDLPLDNGVRALLMGCHKLRRFALYLRQGGLTDLGLNYIGRFSRNVRRMLLGYVGESDEGLLEFSKGCPILQKLEMSGCCFSERALAMATLQLTSLRYLWVQEYRASGNDWDLLTMVRPNWNIELIPTSQLSFHGFDGREVRMEFPAHILAYYSLAGQRTDFPDTVKPLDPTAIASIQE